MKSPVILVAVMLVVICEGVEARGNATDSPPEEHVETFQEFEKRLKGSMGGAIKMVLPFLMRGASSAKISGPCTGSLMKVIGGIRNLREWAIRFLDATGKIPPGLLEGTSFSIGDYDECLEIVVGKKDEVPRTPEETAFVGQYCLLELHRPDALNRAIDDYERNKSEAPIAKTKTFLNMLASNNIANNFTMKIGICVPSKCSQEDIESLVSSESVRNAVGRVTVPYCGVKDEKKNVTTVQLIIMCLFGFIIIFTLLTTCIDGCHRLKNSSYEKKCEQMSYTQIVVKTTSWYSNALAVLNKKRPDNLPCLCGIRPLCVMIITYSHSYAHLHELHFQKFSKVANFLNFFENFTFAGIGNGSVTLDSLVFVVGITISYGIWRHTPKEEKPKLHIVRLLLQRYFRMGLGQLLGVCVFLLLPLIGSGPFWFSYVEPIVENCYKRWWLDIIFISNYWNPKELCIYHTWICSLFMQLTIAGAIVVWMMKKSVRFGLLFMALLTIGGMVGVAAMTIMNDLPGSLAFYMLEPRTYPIVWNDIFTWPYDHVGPFCIGLASGYYIARKKDRLDISTCRSAFLWICAIGMMVADMFGLYDYRHGAKMAPPLAAFYALMQRNVWCLGLSWIVIACSTHHGGPASRVLKSKTFVKLDHLCYMAYVIHMPIVYYHSGIMRERFFMGHFEILFMAISYNVLAFTASFFLHIIFVEPYIALEQHISSFFQPKDKVIFESKTDLREISIPTIIAAESESASSNTNGCVNLGYSKKMDGM